MKFRIKDFFSKCDQIRWKKSLMENFVFYAVWAAYQKPGYGLTAAKLKYTKTEYKNNETENINTGTGIYNTLYHNGSCLLWKKFWDFIWITLMR